jgi:hypothetical protein
VETAVGHLQETPAMRLLDSFSTPCSIAIVIGVVSASSLVAQHPIPPAAQQIAAAITPLPAELQADAAVLGYVTSGKLVSLRAGRNDMICLAPDPAAKSFHSACYHKSMEPFMARGRELRASGVKGGQVDTVRFAEVKSGRIKMPSEPTMLYQIFGGTFDAKTGAVTGGSRLYVTYIPFATAASTGMSTRPSDKDPWLMYPGTPKAHIMFATGM